MNFLKSIAPIDCVKMCTVIATPFTDCVARDSIRERNVGYNVILKQMRQFEMPDISEGWDLVHVVHGNSIKPDLNTFFIHEIEMEHDSPYHKETVQQHMRMAANLAMKAGESSSFYEAVLYHDVGKFYTKVFHNIKGEPTESAHFYGHENVSAYMYLTSSNFKGIEELLLIQYHMMCFKGKKAWDRLEKRLGADFIEKLKRFNKYDNEGRCGNEN